MRVYQELPDAALLDEIKVGNKAAFNELFNRYWKKLLAISYNYTKDQSAAEETVQEVFIGLWNRRKDLNIQSLAPYLATAVKFSVLAALQQQKRREELTLNNYQVNPITLTEEEIYARFLQEQIDGIAARLPEKCRLVFKYSRSEGLSIPEISEAMNISQKTVEAHLSKALKTIRKDLNKSGVVLLLLHQLLK
uniref:RNA polymerase sigma-70 factor n=1 Tax=Pedobacter schmidteae TaxID=2201271 RepID=UPI000EABA9F8|nr:RNA polymerase sigma-70 factor [Pedobacter schmidteae]